ncbi:MAG: hypothetical protein NUV57_01725 [archaeon]|nr:hypothetical protein [archaeon]
MSEKVVLVIGGDMAKDVKKIIEDPSKAEVEADLKIYVESVEQLASILSAKKMNLLQYIQHHKDQSIGEIASKIGRKQEAVSRDVHILKKHGILTLKKKGKKIIPETKTKKITVEFG